MDLRPPQLTLLCLTLALASPVALHVSSWGPALSSTAAGRSAEPTSRTPTSRTPSSRTPTARPHSPAGALSTVPITTQASVQYTASPHITQNSSASIKTLSEVTVPTGPTSRGHRGSHTPPDGQTLPTVSASDKTGTNTSSAPDQSNGRTLGLGTHPHPMGSHVTTSPRGAPSASPLPTASTAGTVRDYGSTAASTTSMDSKTFTTSLTNSLTEASPTQSPGNSLTMLAFGVMSFILILIVVMVILVTAVNLRGRCSDTKEEDRKPCESVISESNGTAGGEKENITLVSIRTLNVDTDTDSPQVSTAHSTIQDNEEQELSRDLLSNKPVY